MAILKLKNAGDEATLDIVKAEVVTGEYGQQVRFDAANGDTLYVPESSVLRQLDRCKVADIEELSGTTLHFYRAPNSKKGGSPFWNIDAARPEDMKTPATNGKPVVQQEPDKIVNPNAKTVPGGVEEAETGASPEAALSPLEAKRKAIREAHGRAFAYVCKHYVPMAAEQGVDLSLEGVSALTFQLFKAQEDVR